MRNIIYSTLIILVTSVSICSAQMHDANWIYSSWVIDTSYIWDFASGGEFIPISLPTDDIIVSTFSDSVGNLRYYADGTKIYNYNHEIIENGDSIQYQPDWNLQQLLYSVTAVSSGEFLPWPGSEDSLVVYLYKVHYLSILDGPSENYHRELWYSVIDIKANNGQGKIISKANVLLDSLYHFVSVQHGNGRDWWVVAYHWYQSQATTFYFNPDGIIKNQMFVFPLEHYLAFEVPSPLVVSGRGDWIYKSFPHNDGYLFTFDRCNGYMVYSKSISIPDSLPPNQPNNIGFRYCISSPEGRYIYGFLNYNKKNENNKTVSVHKILQADVSLPNSTFQYLTTEDSLLAGFAYPQTDPLNKIRFFAGLSIGIQDRMSTIHRPENLLDECGLEIPTTNGIPDGFKSIGNLRFPYYRMGKLEGSECDTLISSVPPVHPDKGVFTMTPNPATHVITVESSLPKAGKAEARLQIVDVMGREVQQQMIMTNAIQQEVDISTLEKGIYFIRLIQANQILGVERFVKIE
ncbi:MAG: T9SS type A sorting domain-containing protein [Saprospiraceae bacterium]